MGGIHRRLVMSGALVRWRLLLVTLLAYVAPLPMQKKALVLGNDAFTLLPRDMENP